MMQLLELSSAVNWDGRPVEGEALSFAMSLLCKRHGSNDSMRTMELCGYC